MAMRNLQQQQQQQIPTPIDISSSTTLSSSSSSTSSCDHEHQPQLTVQERRVNYAKRNIGAMRNMSKEFVFKLYEMPGNCDGEKQVSVYHLNNNNNNNAKPP